MAFQDKTLKCAECGTNFVFTGSEQEVFASRGYTNEPKRCPACRESRRAQRQGPGGFSTGRGTRQMFTAVCAQCGAETQVPFEPRQGRPVYCSDCYNKVRLGSRR
ncbi:MAG: zinc-ribbon domain containing protein [Chloroflexi bacterium]|nr:zinc-ribbon domain containing protein [Chloroflexota bacterium]